MRFRGKVVLGVMLVSLLPSAVRAQSIGLGSSALAFAALSTGNQVIIKRDAVVGINGNGADQGMVGGKSALLQHRAWAKNYVVTDPNGITLQNNALANGCITTSQAKIKEGANAQCIALKDSSGTQPELTTLSDAGKAVKAFSDLASSQPPTQTLPAVKVRANGAITIINDSIINSSGPGLTIIAIPSVMMKKGATMTIQGIAGDTDLFLIDGDFKWGTNTKLLLNGVSDAPLIVVQGNLVNLGKNADLTGTILAPRATCNLAVNTVVTGAVMCGKKVDLARNAEIIYQPSTVTVP